MNEPTTTTTTSAGIDISSLRSLRSSRGNRETAHVFVRETIRMGVLNGHLPPGTRLVQSDLAIQLDVSTTPVREALRDLASEGLIRIDPHRGGVVTQLDLSDMEEIYLIRQRLEPLAIELAAPNITPDDIQRARHLLDKMVEAPDSASWVGLNREFHLALYAPCKRPRLLTTIQQLQDTSVMIVSNFIQINPDIRHEASKEHSQLVDALEAGDGDAASVIMSDHITASIRALTDPTIR